MKKIIKCILLSIVLVNIWAKPNCEHDSHTFRCVKYLKNYDGDSVTFSIAKVHPIIGNKIVVRIRGIDTPELKTKNKCEKGKARTAKKLVKSILKKAKRIDLHNVGRGKYFRLVADIFVDGQLLKNKILKNGLAYEYNGGTKPKIDWCQTDRRIASPK